MQLNILLNGARGKMGMAVAAAAPKMGVTVGVATDQGDDMGAAINSVDVVVDFSTSKATRAVVEIAASSGKPLVIGTTGHSPEEKAALLAIAGRGPRSE